MHEKTWLFAILVVASGAGTAARDSASAPDLRGRNGPPFRQVGRHFDESREIREWAASSRKDFEKWRARQHREFEFFKSRIIREWGAFRNSSQTMYVEYDSAARSVASIDFEHGVVRIEVLNDSAQRELETVEMVRTATERILLSRGSAGPVPVESSADADSVHSGPLLGGQIAGDLDSADVPAVARRLVDSAGIRDSANVAVLSFALRDDHVRQRAAALLPLVDKYCARFRLSRAHVLATIHTESWFNPRARSGANAVGLMQLVPDRGAHEAYRFVFGVDAVPRIGYLFDPENNIMLGCAYIHLLKTRDFGGVKDSASNLFCSVAGYNTGPGNVAFAFTGERVIPPAVDMINAMAQPDLVYGRLVGHLPYVETRRYLRSVVSKMELYHVP